eukprot:gene29637-38760_t
MIGVLTGVAIQRRSSFLNLDPKDLYPSQGENDRKDHLEQEESWFESLRSNVPLRVSFIFGCWLLTGILFYTYSQGWTFYNSYFYCINAGMSIGFGNLVERDYDPYLAFTVVYVLLGSTIVSGSIGFFFSYITSDSQGARVIQWEDSPRSWLNALWYRAKYLSGWYSQRSLVKTLFLFLIWMSFGVIYGMRGAVRSG